MIKFHFIIKIAKQVTLYYKSNIQYFHTHFMLKKSNGRLAHKLYTFSRFSQQIIVV